MFEEVGLEEVLEEDNGLFSAFTLQEEAHSRDEGPSTSTVSNFFILLSNVGYITCYTCMLMQTYACTSCMHMYNYPISCNNIGSFCYVLSVQSVRSVKFTDLISVPHRERAIIKRAKPPSYHLTSEQHIEYIKTKNHPASNQPRKPASTRAASNQKGKESQKKRKAHHLAKSAKPIMVTQMTLRPLRNG